MKIEKPKSDNFLLSVATQPVTQRAVIETIATCTSASQLLKTLEGFSFWPWDRGDALCWAPVLNLFDDYLLVYVAENGLGGLSCKESIRNATESPLWGTVTDRLVERILHVSFLILESCSSRALYQSAELLVALLDSFNPSIVLGSLQCLCLFHSCFRSKTRRQAELRFSADLRLRLPYLCSDPCKDLTLEYSDLTGFPTENSSSKPGRNVTVSNINSNQGQTEAERLGYMLSFYTGRFPVETDVITKKHVVLHVRTHNDGTSTVQIPFRELLDGNGAEDVAQMNMREFAHAQTRAFNAIKSKYLSTNAVPEDGACEELRQKLRLLWSFCHPEGRRRLVDIRLTALSAILCINSQFFLNYLSTCPMLLPDLTSMLRNHELLHKRTLCCVLDLWTGIVQEKVQSRTTVHLLNLSSPHGLFASLLLKFLGNPPEIDLPVPTLLHCPEPANAENDAVRVEGSNAQSQPAHSETSPDQPATAISGTATAQDSELPITVTPEEPEKRRWGVFVSPNCMDSFGRWDPASIDSKQPYYTLIEGKSVLYQEQDLVDADFTSPAEALRLRCRVLENLMELFLAVLSTSTNFGALLHTAVLQRLVEFFRVLDPIYVPAAIGICRIFESLMDFSSSAPATLHGYLDAATHLAQRLQYEIGRLSQLPVLEGDTLRVSTFFPDKPKGPNHQTVIECLSDLSSPQAAYALQLIEEVSHRRCLARVIFKELSSYLHPPESNMPQMQQLLDIFSGPCGLACRLIFQKPLHYGLSLYAAAVTSVTDFVSEDPAAQPTLIRRRIIPEFLASITEDVLQLEETLQAVPSGITAVLLHNSGDYEMQVLHYRPIHTLINVVTREDFVGFDRVGEVMALMGSRLAEGGRNQRNAGIHVAEATLAMVRRMAEESVNLPPWEPVHPDEAQRLTDTYLTPAPATLEDLRLPQIPPSRYFADRLSNMARFLQANLTIPGTLWDFVRDGGPAYVLKTLSSPALPPLFLRVLPHHPMSAVLRILATFTESNQAVAQCPPFIRSLVESLPHAVSELSVLNGDHINKINSDDNTQDCISKNVNYSTVLRALSDLDTSVYLLLASNKDSSMNPMSVSFSWRMDQHVPFVQLLSKALSHLHAGVPILLQYLYRQSVVQSSETPVVLSTRHASHEHPGVRASKKYLSPEGQTVQATNFFWTSLAHYTYSVSNPLFNESGPLLATEPPITKTLLFEAIRATCVQCRLLLATASKFINVVPARRSRSYTHPRITPEQQATAVYLAMSAQEFLAFIPSIPLPRLPPENVRSLAGGMCQDSEDEVQDLCRKKETAKASHIPPRSIPGLTALQTARYIAEVMDILYRLHVDDKNHGSLFTLTVDTFYKFGGLQLIVKGFHYTFGLLLAASACLVAHETQGATKLSEIVTGIAEFLSVEDPQFTEWLQKAAHEWMESSSGDLGLACDVVSKCLHCCVSYCEKITSWKRLYNSPMSAFLQKVCGSPLKPPGSGPRPATFMMDDDGGSQAAVTSSINTPADGPPSSCTTSKRNFGVPLVPPHESQLPLCGSACGSGGEFDAATLLRSLQCHVTRHMMIWNLSFMRPLEFLETADPLYHKISHTLFSHFPAKAVNCLIKVYFHLLDAESPPRKLHTASWKAQHSPTLAEIEERPSQAPDASMQETISRLVELQVSNTVVAGGLDWILTSSGLQEGGSTTEDIPPNTANISHDGASQDVQMEDCRRSIDVAIQTEGARPPVPLARLAALGKSVCVVDWTSEDTAVLLHFLQRLVFDFILDLGWRVLSYPIVIAEASIKLIAVPVIMQHTDGSGTALSTGNENDDASTDVKAITEENSRYCTNILLDRLEAMYAFLQKLPQRQRAAFFNTSPPFLPRAGEGEAMSLSPCPGGKIPRQPTDVTMSPPGRLQGILQDMSERSPPASLHITAPVSSHISPLESTRESPREKATDAARATTDEHATRWVHEALHCYLCTLINLLHRSPIARQTMMQRAEPAPAFFLKFAVLLPEWRRHLAAKASQQDIPENVEEAASDAAQQLHVDVARLGGQETDVLRVFPWCLSPCTPWLLKNAQALQAVQATLAAQRKTPQDQTLPAAILEKPPDIPSKARPPDWLTCCFLGLSEMLRLYEMGHEEGDADAPQDSKRLLIPVDVQQAMIRLCVDVLYYFPGLEGFLATAVVQLLIPLTALIPNSRYFLEYNPNPSKEPPLGGGLGILLRLPRTAHFSGMLRLISAIICHLCESEASAEWRLLADIARIFNVSGEMRVLIEKSENSGPKEVKVLGLNTLLSGLYAYLRRDPVLFRRVIAENCICYVEAETHDSEVAQTSAKAPGKVMEADRPFTTHHEGRSMLLCLRPREPIQADEVGRQAKAINASAAQVIPILLDHLNLFLSVHAHTRLTPPFKDLTEKEESRAATAAQQAPMYPYAVLPDSILFLLDDLLGANPQFATVLLDRPNPTVVVSHAEATLTWPQQIYENVQGGPMSDDGETAQWQVTSCRQRPAHETLLRWMFHHIFTKVVLLCSPECVATAEWKEGERTSPSHDLSELDALSAAAMIGGSRPPFDTLMHFTTRLLRTTASGSSVVQQAIVLELFRIFLEMEWRSPIHISAECKPFRDAFNAAYKQRCPFSSCSAALTPVVRPIFNITVFGAASALCSILHLIRNPAAQNRGWLPPGVEHEYTTPETKHLHPLSSLTPETIVQLRVTVAHLLALVDLKAMDAQPVCRSLVRSLECLARDAVFILFSLGVSEDSLMAYINHPDRRGGIRRGLRPITKETDASAADKSVAEHSRLADDIMEDVTEDSGVRELVEPSVLAAAVAAAAARPDVTYGELEPLGEDMRSGELEVDVLDNDDDEEDDDSSDEDDDEEDIPMVDGEELDHRPPTLPHEADDLEETNGYFGIHPPGSSESDSDEEAFDEEDDVPRIRDDDEDADVILSLLPQDMSGGVSELISGEEEGESQRPGGHGIRLLLGDDEDGGTPGLLRDGSGHHHCPHHHSIGSQDDDDDDGIGGVHDIVECDDNDDDDEDDDDESDLVMADADDEDDDQNEDPRSAGICSWPSAQGQHSPTDDAAAEESVATVSETLNEETRPLTVNLTSPQARGAVLGAPGAYPELAVDPDLDDENDDDEEDDEDDEGEEDDDVDDDDDDDGDFSGLDNQHPDGNVHVNLGFDFFPTGHATNGNGVTSLYLSVPDGSSGRQHATALQEIANVSGARSDMPGGWTVPGDLSLPRFHPILALSRNSRTADVASGIASGARSAASSQRTVHSGAPRLARSRWDFRSHEVAGTEPVPQLASAMSPFQLLFDPWSQTALTSTSAPPTQNLLNAGGASLAPPRSSPPAASPAIDAAERAAVDSVIDNFRHWLKTAAVQRREYLIPPETALPTRVRSPTPPPRRGDESRSVDLADQASFESRAEPQLESSTVTAQEEVTSHNATVAPITVSAVQQEQEQAHTVLADTTTPQHQQQQPSERDDRPDEHEERVAEAMDTTDESQEGEGVPVEAPVAANGADATGIDQQNAQEQNQASTGTSEIRQTESEQHSVSQSVTTGTLTDYYSIVRYEEINQPLGFTSGAIRNLAVALGVTQRQLLSGMGIDPSFLEALPDDIQLEILTQQASSLSLHHVLTSRAENMASIETIRQVVGTRSVTMPDVTGLNYLAPEPPPASSPPLQDVESSPPGVSEQTSTVPPIQPATDRLETTSAASEARPLIQPGGVDAPSSSSIDQPQTSSALTSQPGLQIDPASVRVNPSVLSALTAEVRSAILEMLNGPSAESGNGAPGGGVVLDNANFLASLDPALRQELLLTATDDVLRALPPECVAEAVILRDRARGRSAVPSGSTNNMQQFRRSQHSSGRAFHPRAVTTRIPNPDGVEQIYNALSRIHAMQRSLTRPRRQPAQRNVLQEIGLALRPADMGPGNLSDTLEGLFSDIDISVVQINQTDGREGTSTVELTTLPAGSMFHSRRSPGVSMLTNEQHGDGRRGSRGILRQQTPDAFVDGYSNGLMRTGPERSEAAATARAATHFSQQLASRLPSILSVPISKMAVLAVCRLLYLKRQVYRRDVHRLLFSLATCHPYTRRYLLELLVVIIWASAQDTPDATGFPAVSAQLQSLGFPPRYLFSAAPLSTSMLFDGDQPAAASIAGYRALEHTRSLLEVVPQAAEFFATLNDHPSCVEVQQLVSPLTAVHISPALVAPMEDNDDTEVTASELRRKKKKRDSGIPTWIPGDSLNSASSSMGGQARPLSGTEPGGRGSCEAAPKRSQLRSASRRSRTMSYVEYPINILLMLTGASLFQSSSNHMLHLLSAIHFLLCGSTATPATPGQPASRFQESSSSSSLIQNGAGPPQLPEEVAHTSSGGPNDAGDGNDPGTISEQNAVGEEDPVLPALPQLKAGDDQAVAAAAQASSQTQDGIVIQDKVLNVVSTEAIMVICRVFAGIPPEELTLEPQAASRQSWSLAKAMPAHYVQLPLLARVMARLYRSPKHHDIVHATIAASTRQLIQFIMSCLAVLREHISEVVASRSQQQQKPEVSADLLPPEHMREKFDACLNLLLRLCLSFQEVFLTLETSAAASPPPSASTTSAPVATPAAPPPPPSAEQSRRSHSSNTNVFLDAPAGANTGTPAQEATRAPQGSSSSSSAATATTSDKTEGLKSTSVSPETTEEQLALKTLAAFLDDVGVDALWKVLDALLREVEIACPTLSGKPQLSTSGQSSSSTSSTAMLDLQTDTSADTALLQPNTISASSSSAVLDGPQLSFQQGGNSFTSVSSPPLVINQLLPLLDCYLFAQQIAVAAALNFKASEVPRVVSLAFGTKADPHLQQQFSEKMANLLLTSDGPLTRRHSELLNFCERHRKILNLLIRQSPGCLNGAFQPLVALAPMCISFENKRHFFRQRLKQLREGSRYDSIRLNVRRSQVFMDSFHQLRMRTGDEMKGKLIVQFQGEEGVDAGGLTREWFAILAREMFNPDYALFKREGAKCEFNHPNPLSHVNPDHLCFFKFIGRVIGKAVYDGQHLGAYFTRSFYKHMLGRKVTPADAESTDPEVYKGLQMLLSHNIDDLGLDLRFSTDIDEFGRTQVVDLIPNGRNIPVTEENKHDYVRLVCEHKISHGIRPQIEAFLEGFHELIPPKFLTIFDDKELELLISGLSFVDVNDLRANTEYHNYDSRSPQIIWFWEVLEEMDQNRLTTFLQFVTGTSRVPLGGFRELMGMRGPQMFSIHRDYGETRLPSAHTCFNQLDLPEYSSKELLKSKLLTAISEGKEGFGFV